MRLMIPPCVLFLGCFSPDYSAIPIKCDADNPCPQGQSCGQGVCQAANTVDGATLSDAASDLNVPSNGCANGTGTATGNKAYACPGAFSSGQARSLCSFGWHVCNDATSINAVTCNALPGFFVAEVLGSRLNPPQNPSCSPTSVLNRLLFGCGFSASYTAYYAAGCSGFNRFIEWKTDGSTNQYWDLSAGHSIDKAINHVATDGVLCCL
jgi:hypothetical protein